MIVKKMYEVYKFDFEKIILADFKKLGLDYKEASLLAFLLQVNKVKNVFTVASLSEKTSLEKSTIEEIIFNLIKKNFLSLKLEKNKFGKEREIFILDKTFQKIEELLKQGDDEINQNEVRKSIVLIEKVLNKQLNDRDLETIKHFFEVDKFTFEQISQATDYLKLQNKPTLRMLERTLLSMQNHNINLEKDEDTTKVLNNVFKSIK